VNPQTEFVLKLVPELAADLADPESEMSEFVRQFFINYLVNQATEDQASEVLKKFSKLETEGEQEAFLKQIDAEFRENYQRALTKEIMKVVGSK
jgi:hypothetical protein